MPLRVATIDDREHVLKRVRIHGVEWSEGKVKEVLTDPRNICVIDDEGVFSFWSDDGKVIHAGLPAGFEWGDWGRYKLLWAFILEEALKRWPKAVTLHMSVHPTKCFAPNVYNVATTRTGMIQTSVNAAGWETYEVPIAEFAKKLGVRR